MQSQRTARILKDRVVSLRLQSVLGTWLAVVLLTASVLMGSRLTPSGVHCPTTGIEQVAIEGGYRSPQPGDSEFRQCLCREKQARSESSNLAAGSVFIFVVPAGLADLRILCCLPVKVIPERVIGGLASVDSSPLSPPPDQV